jgi:hypothetical protein
MDYSMYGTPHWRHDMANGGHHEPKPDTKPPAAGKPKPADPKPTARPKT